ncbi:MAG: ABC transporter ATP-binding protein [Alishewanella agri]|jgi:cationic peptide transport system ATP-binding protein|uniref:Peptide ABC transporter ATP-binding protein n=1 Tax=Alishewanella agri BL06 TaxID=1195246 RepID=I8U8X9_9ALTE|nr:ABC transporter ATP-binding protein [Alishewanella agri]EIW89721.1 peptide ABC transporter ATP-binding protein [Alishewanella agri BL06]MDD4863258.1 ABC transporter ATP-binding protein [Alishewanella agri]OZB41746.1 MAG: ABC transporter ATP-binding protein [Alishewanella sp. 34-51-39]
MNTLLEVEQLSKSYFKPQGLFGRKKIQALQNISFSLQSGKTLAIVGETGSGKSTLAKLLVGIEKPDSGQIRLAGQEIQISDYKKYNHVIRFIFQDASQSLNPLQKVGQMLEDVLRFSTILDPAQRQIKIRQTLRQLGLLDEHAEYYPHMFSGGQLQRVALARALILDPKLLILDQALSALDPSLRAQIVNLLLHLQQQNGLAYLLITNNLQLVQHLSDDMLVLAQGVTTDYGATADIFRNPQHDYTRKLLSSLL